MANLIKWILEEAKGERIIGVAIGEMGWGDYGSDAVPRYQVQKRGIVLSWDEAKPLLDYEFDSGHGAPGCNAIYVWTETQILFISQYDGATNINSIPRNPMDVMPEMAGG